MKIHNPVTQIAAAVFLVLALMFSTETQALQQKKPGGFRQWMQALAADGGGSVLGNWSGTKIENDPLHGGYMTINFAFSFSPNGIYQEAAYMGGRQVMSASGTYQQSGNRLSFTPQQCSFATPDLGEIVKFFPIPTDSSIAYAIGFSPLEGGSQISLENSAAGDQWGLKPAR